MPSFDLINEGWVPCVMNGEIKKLGLLETLRDSHEIKEIYDPSPVVTGSLHRLLLAILHRNFGPANSEEWRRLWERGWDEQRLADYFAKWSSRFNLFDAEYPFYQCASLSFSREVPITKLFHELASGNNATLFDHSTEASPIAIFPDDAARILVACQAFAVGGLITCEKGQDRRKFGSADNAPLVKGAMVLVTGDNLFQTLMLNLHRYNGYDAEPFGFDQREDLPAWEKNEETDPEERYPRGYLDLLTWQSRRIKLHPERSKDGNVIVRYAVIMKGNQFPAGYSLYDKETMLAFTKRERIAPSQEPWPAITFSEDRALWRDSLALFQSVENERRRPKTLAWLSDLILEEIIPGSSRYNLSVIGLATNKASILLWRHERLPLPLQYLHDERLLASLKVALQLAEKAGQQLKQSSWYLSKLLIAGDVQNVNKQQREEISQLSDHLSIDTPYWSQLGIIFPRLVMELAEDTTRDGEDIFYGLRTMPWWAGEVRHIALAAFQEAVSSLDQSGHVLKAVTLADIRFRSRLNGILDEVLDPYKMSAERG